LTGSDTLGTKSGAELRKRAANAAASYLDDAIKDIDGQFEAGYAAKHPELVAAYGPRR